MKIFAAKLKNFVIYKISNMVSIFNLLSTKKNGFFTKRNFFLLLKKNRKNDYNIQPNQSVVIDKKNFRFKDCFKK